METTFQTDVAQFIDQVSAPYDGPNRRDHERFVLMVPTQATPLNNDGEPTGETFGAILRDISLSGASILCREPMEATAFKLQFSPALGSFQCEFTVIRAAEQAGFYLYAGPFVP